MEDKYIICDSEISYDISRELLKLSTLKDEGQIFRVIKHPSDNRYAIEIGDIDTQILIHPLSDTTIIEELVQFPLQVIKKLNALITVSKNTVNLNTPEPKSGYRLGRISFSELIKNNVTIRDYLYMIEDGWFEDYSQNTLV